MFQINDKVVCVKGGYPANGNPSEYPLILGNIYTVSHVDPPNSRVSSYGLRVVGNRTWDMFGMEIWWHEKRFRKLTDMQEEARMRNKNSKLQTV